MLSPFWSVITYKGLPSCLNIITFFSEEWKIIDAISICNDVRQCDQCDIIPSSREVRLAQQSWDSSKLLQKRRDIYCKLFG